MITKPVKIDKLYDVIYVDNFVYIITASNGSIIAEMSLKGKKGLKNATLIKTAINQYLHKE